MLSAGTILRPLLAFPAWVSGFALLVLLLLLLSPSWLPEPDPQYKLDKVFFTYSAETGKANISSEVREQIELPHDWRKEKGKHKAGWYEILVYFDTAPAEPQMLYITHVQQRADIWFDDEPVSSNVPEYNVSAYIWSRPLLMRLPETALTAGYHRISINLESKPQSNALLGNIYLAPEHELREYWEWRYHYRFTLVAVITFGMLSLSLFMGVLWLLRRQDTMYLWFTICTLFWSLHNIPHIIDRPRNLSPALWDALYFSLLGWTVVALVIFNHRYTGVNYPRREKFLIYYAIFAALPFFFLSQEAIHLYARWFWDLGLLAIGAYTMCQLAQAHWEKPELEIKLLIMAGFIIFSFGFNDYLVLAGIIDRTRGLLIHFSGFPTMLVLIWFLLSRFLKVVAEAESLNLELEQRVMAKEQELENYYERMTQMEQEQLLSNERSRIMQDVHDGVGGQLVAMLAEIENDKISRADIRDALSQSLTDLRLVIDSLDVASEDIPTLLGTLRSRLQPRLDGHDMKLHWKVTSVPKPDDFGPEKALQLMRILQEIFVNILKHSKARNIYLTTETSKDENDADHIEISIRDDGNWHESLDNTGRGLRNMQRRADSIKAKLKIDGTSAGTTVKILLSIEQP